MVDRPIITLKPAMNAFAVDGGSWEFGIIFDVGTSAGVQSNMVHVSI